MFQFTDEIIADRRKDQIKASKGRATKANKATTVDRSIASGRAKRDAEMKARRGISDTKKATPMQVEKEVYRQSRKTATAKKTNEKKASGGRAPPNSSLREKNNNNAKKKTAPQVVAFGVKNPSKKAVEAAVRGMEAAGFKVPPGHQVIVTFVPVAVAAPAKPDPKGKKQQGPKGGGGGGGDGANKGANKGRGYPLNGGGGGRGKK